MQDCCVLVGVCIQDSVFVSSCSARARHVAALASRHAPEDAEGAPCQVRVLHQRHVLCAAERDADLIAESGERLWVSGLMQ